MATVKVTFTLDAGAVAHLNDAAEQLGKPKSEVVREAIEDYHARIGQLSERERLRMLRAFDELVPRIPSRSREAVDDEIRAIRQARRRGGRKTQSASGA